MRKWLSLAIAIALALGLAAAAEPATYGGTVMLCIDSGEDAYFDDEFRKGFNELYPGITIDLLAVSPLERLEKVMIMLASGNGPDVLVMEQSYYNTLAPTGYMYALDDLVAADPDFSFEMFDPNALVYYRSFDGKSYSVPLTPYNKVLIVNREAFKKYGVEPPAYGMTMEDLLAKARELNKQIVAAGDDQADMRPFCQWEIHLEPLTSQMGVGLYDVDALTPNVRNEQALKAIKFWSDLWNENLMITKEEAKAKGYGDSYKLFVQKQYPMMIENSWIMKIVSDPSVSDLPYEGVYDILPVPAFAGEADVQPPVTQHGIGMTRDVKDPEAAFQVLKYAAQHWYDNRATLTGVYSPSSYLPSKANGVLAELFPSFPKLLEQPAAIDPPLITAIHDEIVWTSIRDVTAEAAIVKTSFEDVTTQIEKAIQEVLDRYKLTL